MYIIYNRFKIISLLIKLFLSDNDNDFDYNKIEIELSNIILSE